MDCRFYHFYMIDYQVYLYVEILAFLKVYMMTHFAHHNPHKLHEYPLTQKDNEQVHCKLLLHNPVPNIQG